MKIKKETDQMMEDFLSESGFELWNSSATRRMSVNGASEKRFAVHDYSFTEVREYETLQGAVNFMMKEDES